MSSSQQAANATTSAERSGLHNIEGTKTGASGSIQADKDHSAETYDGLTSSGKDKLESVQKQVSEAAGHLQAQASAQVDDAVAQGQHDVEETKATTATYLGQAKALAGTALGAAEDVLYRGAAAFAPADPYARGIVTTLQATTSNALEATGGYLASAQAALTSEVPQETKDGIPEALDNAKNSTAASATAPTITSKKSATNEPSQAVSNTQAAIQPHIDAAQKTASSLFNSATQTAATISKASSTQIQDTKAAASGYTTAATKAAQAYTSKPREADSGHAQSIQQGAQPLMGPKGVLNSRQEPVTPVGLPAEGIEGVLTYGEDKSNSTK